MKSRKQLAALRQRIAELKTAKAQRKRVEGVLRESEEKFRLLAEQSPNMIFINQKGRIVYANAKCEELMGYTKREFYSPTFDFLALIAPEHLGRTKKALGKHSKGEEVPPYEYALVTKHGKRIEAIIATKLIRYADEPAILGIITDISGRKQAEESLRVEKGRLERASHAANIALWEWDMTTGRLEWSNTVDSMLGYEPGTFPHTLQKWEEIVHPDDRDWEFQVLARHLEAGTPYDVEYRVKRKDGNYIWWHDMGACRRDAQGKAYQMSGVCIDVTARKLAEDLLRQNEERYRQLFELESDAVVQLDCKTGQFLQVNAAAIALYGYSRDEWLRLKHIDISTEPEKTIEVTSKELTYVSTRWHRKKDGTIFPVEVTCSFYDWQGRRVEVAAIRDITERKQMEEYIIKLSSLKQQLLGTGSIKEKFKLITEGVVKIFGADLARIWLIKKADLCEEGCCHAAATEVPNVCRDRTHCLHLVASSGRYTQIDGSHRRVPFGCYKIGRVASGEDIGFVTNDVTSDSRVHDHVWAKSLSLVSFAGFRLISTDQKPVGVLALFSKQAITPDIGHLLEDLANATSQVVITGIAEEEQRKLEAQVQQSQRLESLGVLAGGIAHDFNNLLTSVLGNVGLAQADLPLESPVQESLKEIENATHSAAELCRQMLAYSGRGRFVMEQINLSRLTQELIHLLQSSISKKAVLNCKFADTLPAVEADPSQVRQVVMNLVINASEAIGDKEGIITISTGTVLCDQNYLWKNHFLEPPSPGTYVFLEVLDTGCGMDAETKSKIFDPFFTTKFTGRGLGLAAVLGIMRQHKGAIKVTSKPGKGTTFMVLFPISTKTASQPQPDALPKPWHGSGTIMVVDDEAAVRNVTRIILERSGFSVLTASDGREAIKLFQKHGRKIACVILDLTMPHMNGEETYRELRRISSDVPVIMASGYSEQEIAKHFTAQDPPGFIEKPFEATTLMAKLRNTLGKSKPRDPAK